MESDKNANRRSETEIIRIDGPLDHAQAMAMREEVTRLCAEERARMIVVDLAGVSSVQSLGIGMLVSAHKSCERYGVAFAIVGVSESLATILKVTGLDSRLSLYPTVDAALEATASE